RTWPVGGQGRWRNRTGGGPALAARCSVPVQWLVCRRDEGTVRNAPTSATRRVRVAFHVIRETDDWAAARAVGGHGRWRAWPVADRASGEAGAGRPLFSSCSVAGLPAR